MIFNLNKKKGTLVSLYETSITNSSNLYFIQNYLPHNYNLDIYYFLFSMIGGVIDNFSYFIF